jgi:hypothetical protein
VMMVVKVDRSVNGWVRMVVKVVRLTNRWW